MSAAVEMWKNPDGTWSGRIFGTTFTGSRDDVVSWIRANGEAVS